MAMFSTWDLVRPPMWHPMSVLELSLMDEDELPRPLSVLSVPPMISMTMALPTTTADDEFFKDLPIGQATAQQQQQTRTQTPQEPQRAFSSYSFSRSMVHDAQGRMIGSTRRRYEDSTGRLKAVHEREVDGCRLVSVWNKKDREDEGDHRTLASQGSTEEFEKMWADTPFGKAHAQKQQLEQEQQGQHKQHKKDKKDKKEKHGKHEKREASSGAGGAKMEETSSATPAMGQQQQQ